MQNAQLVYSEERSNRRGTLVLQQYCVASTNHLHHEDGSFQQYIALDADYLTLLPDDVDPKVMGPVLCAGLTAYKVSLDSRD